MTYEEAIAGYEKLAEGSFMAQLHAVGSTDVGQPLHVLIIDKDGDTDLGETAEDKVVVLINNGIHPGEPCGIDASFKLATNLLSRDKKWEKLLNKTRVCIIPVYNVGGALNRGCCSRANQNGPDAYGFRGNARNLDLNRDFIKSDSQNAWAFQRIFQAVRPQVFVDTHTSNGADYQYTMTMITTQPDKATEALTTYIRDRANPEVFKRMADRGWEMTPYVNSMGRTPNSGIQDFLETPRYSTGYAALYHALGFTAETHMFKPFADRVESTYQFLWSLLELANDDRDEILRMYANARAQVRVQQEFALSWELDTTQWREIPFRGYKVDTLISEVTGQERIRYDRDRPENLTIRYFDHFKPKVTVKAPSHYIIPQGWHEVLDRLKANGVRMYALEEDEVKEVEAYHISDYDTGTRPYEGHYLHRDVEVEVISEDIQFRAGDFLIPVDQYAKRYIIETLEPQGVDSFFAWNFFDSILQQKEWFSDYVFEDKAAEMLLENPALKTEFEEKQGSDEQFAASAFYQLYWLYQHSNHYEQSFNRYPVYRFHQSSSE